MSGAPIEIEIDLGRRKADAVIRINRRARRLILRVDTLAERVLITAPSRRQVGDAVAFAKSRADWICAQFDAACPARPFEDGCVFPFEGREVRLQWRDDARSRATLSPDGVLAIGGDAAHLNRRVVDWLKRRARERLTALCDNYVRQLNVKRGAISVRDSKSRWGSCSSDGALSFSWRLIMTPPAIIDYVAAHECAHLVHLDHSPAFWRLVEDLGHDAEDARDWFKQHGAALHAWGVKPRAA